MVTAGLEGGCVPSEAFKPDLSGISKAGAALMVPRASARSPDLFSAAAELGWSGPSGITAVRMRWRTAAAVVVVVVVAVVVTFIVPGMRAKRRRWRLLLVFLPSFSVVCQKSSDSGGGLGHPDDRPLDFRVFAEHSGLPLLRSLHIQRVSPRISCRSPLSTIFTRLAFGCCHWDPSVGGVRDLAFSPLYTSACGQLVRRGRPAIQFAARVVGW